MNIAWDIVWNSEVLHTPFILFEGMSDIQFETQYTTVTSQGTDARCLPGNVIIPETCDKWCPDTLDIWIQVM